MHQTAISKSRADATGPATWTRNSQQPSNDDAQRGIARTCMSQRRNWSPLDVMSRPTEQIIPAVGVPASSSVLDRYINAIAEYSVAASDLAAVAAHANPAALRALELRAGDAARKLEHAEAAFLRERAERTRTMDPERPPAPHRDD